MNFINYYLRSCVFYVLWLLPQVKLGGERGANAPPIFLHLIRFLVIELRRGKLETQMFLDD